MEFSNFAITREINNLDDIETSLLVQDGSVFPEENFHIMIGNEILLCSTRVDDELTVIRGQKDTLPSFHKIGDLVSGIITKDDVDLLGGMDDEGPSNSAVIYDQFGNRPAPGIVGRLFISNDYLVQSYDNGTEWKSKILGSNIKEYDDSQFSWVNQGTATINVSRGYAVLHESETLTSVRIRAKVKSAPSVPYAINAFVNCVLYADNTQDFGLCFRTASSGNLTLFSLRNSRLLGVRKYTNAATFHSDYSVGTALFNLNTTRGFWLRIEDDGTNRRYLFSVDGYSWVLFFSHSRMDFHTPDQVGWFLLGQNSRVISGYLYSWEEIAL